MKNEVKSKNIREQIEKYIVSSEDFKKGDDTEHAVRIDKFSDSSIDMYGSSNSSSVQDSL